MRVSRETPLLLPGPTDGSWFIVLWVMVLGGGLGLLALLVAVIIRHR